MSIIQRINDSGSSRDYKKRLKFGYIWKVEPIGFSD